MSLYVLSDLHLSTATDKSMELFGTGWQNYHERIKKNWNAVVCPEDLVVVPGDVSWALSLCDAVSDFSYIQSLRGRKLLGKGNHDFWWSTAAKMHAFTASNGFDSIDFLYNNAFLHEDFVVCGTRGWFYDEKQQKTSGETDYEKIVSRESMRLEASIKAAETLRDNARDNIGKEREILVFLHFPPVWGDFVCREFIDIMKAHGIRRCYFGHIHGSYSLPRSFDFEGISMILTSADFLRFSPMPVLPD